MRLPGTVPARLGLPTAGHATSGHSTACAPRCRAASQVSPDPDRAVTAVPTSRVTDRDRRTSTQESRASPWLERLTRAGYAAKGVLYLLIGSTGLLVALGLAEEARGSRGAIRLIAALPMGRLLIAALSVGLAGYSLLSFVAAMRAPEGTRGVGGALARAGDAVAGVVYAGLVALAVRLLADPQSSTRVATEWWAARLLGAAGGRALFVAAGLVVSGAALYLLYKAAAAPVVAHFERRRLARGLLDGVAVLARLGLTARAVLFALSGWLLFHAGWTGDPRRVGGLGAALDALAAAPAGRAVVGLVAAGCVAYGIYQLAKARWRRVRLDGRDDRVAVRSREAAPIREPG